MKVTFFEIAEIYQEKGYLSYDGDGISQLDHAWQCGQLAKESGASPKLQLAAWLHDIGHLLSKKEGTPTTYGHNDHHEQTGGKYLAKFFSGEVTQPVLMHVLAKRYLVTTDANYYKFLSPDSIRSLALQGGEMSKDECDQFIGHPFASDAILLRRWDELGKDLNSIMPSKLNVITELRTLVEECI
jgi:phosphonate degradation associated HDIG domain protein